MLICNRYTHRLVLLLLLRKKKSGSFAGSSMCSIFFPQICEYQFFSDMYTYIYMYVSPCLCVCKAFVSNERLSSAPLNQMYQHRK